MTYWPSRAQPIDLKSQRKRRSKRRKCSILWCRKTCGFLLSDWLLNGSFWLDASILPDFDCLLWFILTSFPHFVHPRCKKSETVFSLYQKSWIMKGCYVKWKLIYVLFFVEGNLVQFLTILNVISHSNNRVNDSNFQQIVDSCGVWIWDS